MNERVRELRKYLGLTLEKFGEHLGVTRVAISNIENGNRNLTEQMKKSICREFNVDYIWLTTGQGDMFQEQDDEAAAIDLLEDIMSGDYPSLQKCISQFVKIATIDDLKNLNNFIERMEKEPEQ